MKTMTGLPAAALVALLAAGMPRLSIAQDGEAAPPEPAGPAGEEEAPAPGDGEDDVFIPTEEIPADEEITFPVNI